MRVLHEKDSTNVTLASISAFPQRINLRNSISSPDNIFDKVCGAVYQMIHNENAKKNNNITLNNNLNNNNKNNRYNINNINDTNMEVGSGIFISIKNTKKNHNRYSLVDLHKRLVLSPGVFVLPMVL